MFLTIGQKTESRRQMSEKQEIKDAAVGHMNRPDEQKTREIKRQKTKQPPIS